MVHAGVDRTPIILLVASLGPKLLWDELNFQYWTREEDNCVFRRLEVQTGTSSSSRSRTRAWLDFFNGENPVAGWIFQMGDVNKWLVRTVMGNIDVQCWRHLQTYLHKKYRNWCQHTYCKSWYIYEWAQAESKPIQPFLTTRQHQKYKFLVIVSNTAHLMMNYSTLKYWPWDFHFPFLQTKLLARQEWWISH